MTDERPPEPKRPTSLNYQPPSPRNSNPVVGQPGENGLLGCMFWFCWAVMTVVIVWNVRLRGDAIGLALLASFGVSVAVAVVLNWVAGRRGFFAGYLLGVGLSLLVPAVTLYVLCGGVRP